MTEVDLLMDSKHLLVFMCYFNVDILFLMLSCSRAFSVKHLY